MKSTLKFFALAFLFIGAGCEKEVSSDAVLETAIISEKMVEGSWIITKMVDSGKDEAYHFTGFHFTFNMDGKVTAQKDDRIKSGIWRVLKDSSDDDLVKGLEFFLSFNSKDEFEELNDDWHILEHNNEKIELIDVSGGNGGTDYLTFERK